MSFLDKLLGRRNGYHHNHRLPTEADLEGAIETTPDRFAELAKAAGWSEQKIIDQIDQCLLNTWPIELGGQKYEIVNSSKTVFPK